MYNFNSGQNLGPAHQLRPLRGPLPTRAGASVPFDLCSAVRAVAGSRPEESTPTLNLNPKNKDWITASRAEPCWHCRGTGWCRRARNGTVTICRRNLLGGEVMTDSAGVEYCKVIHERELVERTTPRASPSSEPGSTPDGLCAARSDALAFVRTYSGPNRFLTKMRREASDPDWVPTINQARSIITIRSEIPVSDGGGGGRASIRSRPRRNRRSARSKQSKPM